MNKRSFYALPSADLLPNRWDVLAILLVVGLIMLFAWAGSHMTLPFHLGQQPKITLTPSALPLYALQTVLRMFIALALSFVFTFVVATAAAKSARAGKIIIPLIDILQSVPILGYLSITVTGFIALFPGSMLGPACAAIFAVFVSQVWNMTLSFYQSLTTIPGELREATQVYQLSPWQRFWRLEVPFAMPGLLWNAMMSMSGGWFFIVAAEAISVANQNIMLPGIGSYIALAIDHKDLIAITYAIIAMLVVILLYDQVFFRPLIAWSSKFRLTDMPDDSAESWLLTLLQRTRILQHVGVAIGQVADSIVNTPLLRRRKAPPPTQHLMADTPPSLQSNVLWYCLLVVCFGISIGLIWHFIYRQLPVSDTWHVILLGAYTGIRVFVLIVLCSVIWVPVGIWVGMRPKVAQKVQPLAQFIASFPANLFFPLAVFVMVMWHLNFEIWCAPLMILGTQWYILFNVIAGASGIPKEIKLAAKNMQLHGWLKWKRFLLPSIFPYYVTGAITAAGGAWNASIVAEIINWGHRTLIAQGLGSYISLNTTQGHFAKIALGVVIMCLWVIVINLLVWRPLYKHAQNRYGV